MTEWPVGLQGVTETVVATKGPSGLFNFAALGLHAGSQVTARTWGTTRTRRNFSREESGYILFISDPVFFVDAALGIVESEDPIPDDVDAWVLVNVVRQDTGMSKGTEWVDWELTPIESSVDRTRVPMINRGVNAVIEASVLASRLDVSAFDEAALQEQLDYFRGVVDSCGGHRAKEAMDRIDDYITS